MFQQMTNNFLLVERVDLPAGDRPTVGANTKVTATMDVSKTGYKPLGLVGVVVGSASAPLGIQYFLSPTSSGDYASVQISNSTSNAIEVVTCYVHVLYQKV